MTIDFENSIISSLLDCVDAVGANLVANTYHNLVKEYSFFIWTMVSIYIGFVFIRAMLGHQSYDEVLAAVFKVIFILMLALNYNYFCLFIYDIVTKEPLVILKSISINGKESSVVSVNQALDNFLHLGLSYANKLYLLGSWNNLSYFIFALIVFLMSLLGAIFATGLIILSKCAAIILLALSPLFIFFALFEMTRGLFESYIRHLITYALIPILTSVILMILFSVSEYVIQYMNKFPQASFKVIAPFLLLCGIQIYLLAQVYAKASALGAGFALGSFVSTLNKTKDNMMTAASGLAGVEAGRKALANLSTVGSVRHQSFNNPRNLSNEEK